MKKLTETLQTKLFKMVAFILTFAIILPLLVTPSYAATKINLKTTSKYQIDVGQTVTLYVKGAKNVKWKSSNKQVVSVSSKGTATGKKSGKSTITATVGTKKYKIAITVKKLSNVTFTVPSDFVNYKTQKDLDKSIKDNGYDIKSATLNSDGSVTYVMSQSQHKKFLNEISITINKALQEMVASADFPNITKIETNSNFTEFKITTKSDTLSFEEAFSVIIYYMYSGFYSVFSGESVDNVHIDFINADTGKIIESSDSKDLS